MPEEFYIPGGVVSMTGEAAGRLVSAGDGDAALLYISLLYRRGDYAAARKGLGWTEDRMLAAQSRLAGLKLVKPAVITPAEAEKPEPDEPPEYTAADITQELQSGSPFSALVPEVERRLGKLLSTTDLKILFTIYDYLALPADVILLLVTWCVRQTEEKYGPGRKPTVPQLRSEAFRWKRRGVDTYEAAEEYLQRMSKIRTESARLLSLLGITGRAPVEGERKYLDAWAELGFEDEAVRLAYEKTVLKKQAMNWPYMNSILKNWHQKGLHTVAQIRTEDSGFRRASYEPVSPPSQAEADRQARSDIQWMKDFLAKQKGSDENGG